MGNCLYKERNPTVVKHTPAIGGAALGSGKGTIVVLSGRSPKDRGSKAIATKSDLHSNADFGITNFT